WTKIFRSTSDATSPACTWIENASSRSYKTWWTMPSNSWATSLIHKLILTTSLSMVKLLSMSAIMVLGFESHFKAKSLVCSTSSTPNLTAQALGWLWSNASLRYMAAKSGWNQMKEAEQRSISH